MTSTTPSPSDAGPGASSSSSPGTLHSLMASSAAALCSRLCTHPLDTLKTRVQVSNTQQPLIPTFHNLVRNGGLYRGLPIAMALSVPGLSIYLTVYDLSKDFISRQSPYLGTDSIINHMSSAVVAEVTSGLFWTPMEVLKSKQQVENIPSSTALPSSAASSNSRIAKPLSTAALTATTIHTEASAPAQTPTPTPVRRAPIGILDLARKIYQREGLRGFYRGYFITLGVFVPYSMIYFATYEQLKENAWRQRQSGAFDLADQQEEILPFFTIVMCAAVAAGIAGGVSNMVDVVKTRWQTSILATTEENSSTRNIIRHMIRQGGLASFTRGMGARILWMIPSVTISMSTFEWLKAYGFA